jgi:hypothetical protein
MTAKEQLLRQAPDWSEHDAEVALRAVEHEHGTEARPGDIVDEWGNLSVMTRASTARVMRRLDEEEIAEHGETIGEAFARAERENARCQRFGRSGPVCCCAPISVWRQC